MAETSELLPIAREIALNRVGRTMAKAMATTVSTAALSQVARHIDLTALLAARSGPSDSSRRSLTVYVLAAVARALPVHPLLNGRLDGNTVVVPAVVNLGVAVATDEGLLVPVVNRADQLTIAEIDARVADLAARARAGQLRSVDVDGGTFTVSNLGMMGIDQGFALPPPPQAAILLVGRALPTFEPDDAGAPRAVTRAFFGLTFDHRFVDGATAAAFLDDLSTRLSSVAEEG